MTARSWKTLPPDAQVDHSRRCADFRRRIAAIGHTPTSFADLLGVKRPTMALWTRRTYCLPPPELVLRILGEFEVNPSFRASMEQRYPYKRKTRGKPFSRGGKGGPGRRKRTSESNNEYQEAAILPTQPVITPFSIDIKFSPAGWLPSEEPWPDYYYHDAMLRKGGKDAQELEFRISSEILSDLGLSFIGKDIKKLRDACYRAYGNSDNLSAPIWLERSDFTEEF